MNYEKIDLEFTGERLVPNKISPKSSLYVEHFTRYQFAQHFANGKVVLDAGCGCGYGSDYLSHVASRVEGIDISVDAINYAKQQHKRHNLNFSAMDCCDIKFKDNKFNVVVAFEFIEHIKEQDKFLSEIARLLRTGGVFLVSTPNKTYHNQKKRSKNPYHLLELNLNEFKEKLERYFSKVTIYGQKETSLHVLNRRVLFLEQEVKEFQFALSHLPLTLIKSFIPKAIKQNHLEALKRRWNVLKNKEVSVSDNSYMPCNDMEISEGDLDKALYLIGVCEL